MYMMHAKQTSVYKPQALYVLKAEQLQEIEARMRTHQTKHH